MSSEDAIKDQTAEEQREEQTQTRSEVAAKEANSLREIIKDWSSIAQSFATIIALAAAAWWFLWQGETSPKANISHLVTHRKINDQWTWIRVSITISNVGKVSLDLASGIIRVQKILPLDSGISKKLERREHPIQDGDFIVLWPRIGSSYNPQLNVTIAPAESDRLNYEFVVPSYLETVKIYSYFEKQKKPLLGWSETTIYDLKEKKGD